MRLVIVLRHTGGTGYKTESEEQPGLSARQVQNRGQRMTGTPRTPPSGDHHLREGRGGAGDLLSGEGAWGDGPAGWMGTDTLESLVRGRQAKIPNSWGALGRSGRREPLGGHGSLGQRGRAGPGTVWPVHGGSRRGVFKVPS